MGESEKKKIYSYHTFVLPFTWKMSGVKVDDEYLALKKVFEGNQNWVNTNLSDETNILSKSDIIDDENVKHFYKEYQYFYPYVRKAIYGYEHDICSNYLFAPIREKGGEYLITKNEITYKLSLKAIRVRLVNTGVGLFIIECEYPEDANKENDKRQLEDDIKNINNYGRRIKLPFISQDNNIINADSLEITIGNDTSLKEDFKQQNGEIIDTINKKTKEEPSASGSSISLSDMAGFITKIMGYGYKDEEYSFTSSPLTKKNEIQIIPALDDRMYVAYAVSVYNKRLGKSIFKTKTNTKTKDEECYVDLTDQELNKSLYEYAYVDPAEGCSCPDKRLREELLEKAVYSRWAPYGTIYLISEIGFGMLSNAEIGGNDNHLYETFLTCYLQMVYIALLQKASIVNYYRETANIARHFSANSRKLDRNDIRRIMNLQERHVAFDSQLFFSEVSPEQQAIEMYDMLKESFHLESENKKLEETLTSLYEITDTDLNISVNTTIGFLTWLSVILAAASIIYNILFSSDVVIRCDNYSVINGFPGSIGTDLWIFIIAVVLLSVVAIVGVSRHNRRK